MGDRLQLAVGLMGNAASLLLFAAPILTFARVIRKQSTENFSCIPYTISLLSCLIYTWYGLPIVSNKWENFPLASINGLGILLETSFIVIYFWFATTKGKTRVAAMVIPVLLVFCVTAVMSALMFHDHQQRKVFVGSVGVLAAVVMYGSPLVVVRQVIRTKSVEYMPFSLSFFSFMSSTLWMTYGLFGHDMFIAGPNIAATPLCLLQLVLYFKYRKNTGFIEEPNKWDIEQNVEKSKQLELEKTNNDITKQLETNNDDTNCKSGMEV